MLENYEFEIWATVLILLTTVPLVAIMGCFGKNVFDYAAYGNYLADKELLLAASGKLSNANCYKCLSLYPTRYGF